LAVYLPWLKCVSQSLSQFRALICDAFALSLAAHAHAPKVALGARIQNPKTENTAMSAKNGRQTAQMSVD